MTGHQIQHFNIVVHGHGLPAPVFRLYLGHGPFRRPPPLSRLWEQPDDAPARLGAPRPAEGLTARDLALLHSRRTIIESALDRCMPPDGQHHLDGGRAAQVLFRQLLSYLATGRPPQADAVMPYRRHASRFGDALRAVLSDMVGTDGSPELPLRCVDAFWDCLRLAARSASQARPANITVNS